MAESAEQSGPQHRNILHCLICKKPQKMLSLHLTRTCMKKSTPEEKEAERQRAKKSFREWVQNARTWDFLDIFSKHPTTYTVLVKDLLERGFFVKDLPLVFPPPTPLQDPLSDPSKAPLAAPSVSPDSSAEESSSSDESVVAQDDPTCQRPQKGFSSTVKVKMQKHGLHQKFPQECRLISGFKDHLINVLCVTNCQQEVDNVSRWLRYIQPEAVEPTLDFLHEKVKATDFLKALKESLCCLSTRLNYIKNMIRFVKYVQVTLEYSKEDPQLNQRCRDYIDCLKVARKPIAREYNMEEVSKKYTRLKKGTRSVKDCQKVLSVATPRFLEIFRRLSVGKDIGKQEKTFFKYYLEANIMLGHFQRPVVVEGLKVSDWLNRQDAPNGKKVVAVKDHNTAANHIATFAISLEEEAWMDVYFKEIRPVWQSCDVDDEDRFFLSATGRPIKSSSSDVQRLHEMFNVANVTSTEVRKASEIRFSTERKHHSANYPTHATEAAESDYHGRDHALVANTISPVHSHISSSSSEEEVTEGRSSSRTAVPKLIRVHADFSAFVTVFPVSNDGLPPTKKMRKEAGFGEDRFCYDKWRASQYTERQKYILSLFCHSKPTLEMVREKIERQGWESNCPKPEEIISLWKPASKTEVQEDRKIARTVKHQRWRGLHIKDFGSERGLGVVATRRFSMGDIVCDYHGKVVTKEEGQKLIHSYVFFFKSREKELAIDTQTFPCECHPDIETFGRRINRSRKQYNLKPLHREILVDGIMTDTILLQATKDIEVDEELILFWCSFC
ncbi:uncharacterized protein si:dkey-23a23.2 [Polypterus senegalus]|uniref:uncharacterized protein si:dkey-23a23.2 n=1 Tax=Polypterus senegalus TaxID=55291 RepID=UPI001964B54F|nr:uncharacterized protein si:dkey-23a23.2 [Polypterus senegalus]